MRVEHDFAVFRSRFWKKLLPKVSLRKLPPTSSATKRASGWNRLPPELVDEILGYLSDDLPTLKACALTCKIMLRSACPLIGSWLCLIPARNRKPNARSIKSLLKRSKGGSDGLERLVAADRHGLLQYTRHMVIRMDDFSLVPQSLQPYTPYFHSIDKLQTLIIDGLDVPGFIPVFDDCFGMFTHSLRSLDIKHIWDSDRQLLFFISQFPLLEDLSIRSCYAIYFFLGPSPPTLRTSPPFRGHLNLSLIMDSQSLCEAMAQLPGGLKFTSLELKGCGKPAPIITACRSTLRTVSYTWTTSLVAGRTLDLKDSSILEKFDFKVDRANLAITPAWLYRTLWKINSPAFNEFTILVSNCSSATDLRTAMNGGDWKTVDAYLCVLAKFQPSFKVVLRVGFKVDEDHDVIKLVGECFPLASNKGIVKIERSRGV